MRMTPTQITAAYRAAVEVSKTVLPYQVARRVAKLLRALAAEVDVVAAADRALADQFGGEVSAGGSITFRDQEQAAEFAAARAEYLRQEADIHLPRVDLSKYVDMMRITPEAIYALDGIVVFDVEEGDDDG